MDGRPIVIEENAEEAERGLFYLPWVDLRYWLRNQCARFNKHPWLKRLEPPPTRTYRYIEPTELRLIYRCKAGEFTMRLSYFHEVRGFAYRIDGEPFVHAQYVTAPHGKAPFGTPGQQLLTVAQAGRRILSVLLNASNATTARIC